MADSVVVRFAIPSDAKHIAPEETHFACACPECLQYRHLMMVWPLSRFVVIVGCGHFQVWMGTELEEMDKSGVPQEISDKLVEHKLVGAVEADVNWPTAKYMAYRRKEIYRWLKPTGVAVPSLR